MSEADVIEFTISLVGESGVGKTALINRKISNCYQETSQTVGYNIFSDSFTKQNQLYEIKFVDPSGNPYYKDTIFPQIRSSHCIILVTDLTQTVENIETWYKTVSTCLRKSNVFYYLALNKADLIQDNSEKTKLNEFELFADSLGIPLYKVSAKTGSGVNEMFESVQKKLLLHSISSKANSVKLSSGRHSRRLSEKKNKSCC
jgi:small GTP-binding protein